MLTASYSSSLVLISLCVAILASYTALDLAGRIATARGYAASLWMIGGALAMGTGIWSMHFVGMLALQLPVELGYDLTLTACSLLIAVLSSGFALWLVSQPRLPGWQLVFGALVMGAGISSMHYLGMAALRMQGRASAPSEEKYLSAWAEMGFPAETVAEAYDRTILHCHEFRWPYCNGILKRWHEKGLHTLAEVRAENAKEQSKPKKNTTGGNAWMKEYLNQ